MKTSAERKGNPGLQEPTMMCVVGRKGGKICNATRSFGKGVIDLRVVDEIPSARSKVMVGSDVDRARECCKEMLAAM